MLERPWVKVAWAAWGCDKAIVARLSSFFVQFATLSFTYEITNSSVLIAAPIGKACSLKLLGHLWWQNCKLPPYVLVHGTKFSIKHALSYTKGGFPSIWHNEIRDLTANLLTEVSMSGLSLNFYPLMVRCSLALHHTLRMGQDGYCC